MDPALGPPEEMTEKREELTPMMRQYYELCARYDDAIVLFQVGDFYETFCGAAERTARLLELTLTSREDSTGEYPMTGIPIDNAASYIEGLLEAGYRVAVADQVQDPEETTGVVDRAVTRVITPGTLTEDELLASDDNNFVAALARADAGEGPDAARADREDAAAARTARDREDAAAARTARDREDAAAARTTRDREDGELALALLDVSTGDFLATSSTSSEAIADELSRFEPSEALLGPGVSSDLVAEDVMVTPYDRGAFDRERARDRVAAYFGEPDGTLAGEAEVCACGALLSYAEYARGGTSEDDEASDEARLEYITHLTRYDPREYLLLDAVALRSLELFEPRAVHGHGDATLVGVLDETASALGGRQLKEWIRRPLLEPAEIESRLDAVEELTASVRIREALHDLLRDVYDLERLIGRISRERANARDLRSLRDTLSVVPDVRELLVDAESERLRELHEALDPLADVRELVERSIVENPPAEITEGGVIAEGYDADLDSLRETAREGKRWIDDLEARERERTGIDSLKVGHNSVHGYYIEVTNPNLEAVPEDYQRRQTLKNAERFVTPELKAREDEIVSAEGRADEYEYELFREVRRDVADEVERVQSLAEALATLDALVSLATVAAEYDYCRPEIHEAGEDGPEIRIGAGRHPVVERTQSSFVPNDAILSSDRRLAVITGPNMSGKSTYMRQVALITLLAQVGSFVPARGARITPVDRIFTRVGASDDIAGGRSTFMVEMDELATILEEADGNSLVLLDEVGRGTSTADGLAIAGAMAEHLHDEVGALTLFATHHHPLTELADELEAAHALRFEASEADGEVVFDHEIAPGAAEGSYGVEVATAAGVPDPVVERARELLEENAGATLSNGGSTDGTANADGTDDAVTADGGDDPTDVAAELRALDIARMTPVEALSELDRLKRLLEE